MLTDTSVFCKHDINFTEREGVGKWNYWASESYEKLLEKLQGCMKFMRNKKSLKIK